MWLEFEWSCNQIIIHKNAVQKYFLDGSVGRSFSLNWLLIPISMETKKMDSIQYWNFRFSEGICNIYLYYWCGKPSRIEIYEHFWMSVDKRWRKSYFEIKAFKRIQQQSSHQIGHKTQSYVIISMQQSVRVISNFETLAI